MHEANENMDDTAREVGKQLVHYKHPKGRETTKEVFWFS